MFQMFFVKEMSYVCYFASWKVVKKEVKFRCFCLNGHSVIVQKETRDVYSNQSQLRMIRYRENDTKPPWNCSVECFRGFSVV